MTNISKGTKASSTPEEDRQYLDADDREVIFDEEEYR